MFYSNVYMKTIYKQQGVEYGKPRTSHMITKVGEDAIPWLLKSASKNNIKVIATSIEARSYTTILLDAVEDCKYDNVPEFIIQIGTRNAQNFELLKSAGSQTRFPILYKRGFGNTLDESFNAAEYIAESGNKKYYIVLRGVKSCFELI